jgi:hypothetical protein
VILNPWCRLLPGIEFELFVMFTRNGWARILVRRPHCGRHEPASILRRDEVGYGVISIVITGIAPGGERADAVPRFIAFTSLRRRIVLARNLRGAADPSWDTHGLKEWRTQSEQSLIADEQ